MREGEEQQAARPAFGRVLGLVAGGIAAGDTTCGREAAERVGVVRKPEFLGVKCGDFRGDATKGVLFSIISRS